MTGAYDKTSFVRIGTSFAVPYSGRAGRASNPKGGRRREERSGLPSGP